MTPDPGHVCEKHYVTAWAKPARESVALAIDEQMGRVRPEFARWVRAGRPSK